MPGYLSNRLISLEIASKPVVDALDSQVDSIAADLIAAQADIEDLQLNIGV